MSSGGLADRPLIAETISLPGSCWLCNSTRSISLAQIRFPGTRIARCAGPALPSGKSLSARSSKHSAYFETLAATFRNVTFVSFRPGSPRAERKLRDRPYEKQIGTDPPDRAAGSAPCQSGRHG